MDKETLTQIARDMAEENGLINLTRADICERAGIPNGSFYSIVEQTFVSFVESLGDCEPFGGSPFVTRNRAVPFLRKAHILAAAVELATTEGYSKITRRQVAEAAGVSPPLITRHFISMNKLRIDIMSDAVKNEILPIVAQGLVDGHPLAVSASMSLKQRAAETLTS